MNRVMGAYKANFMLFELGGSVAVAFLLIAAVEWVWGRDELFEILKGNRQALYASIATIAGSLLGFIVTTVSIILAFADSPRMRVVRQSRHYQTIFIVFFSAIRFLAIATAAALVALLWDRESDPTVEITYAMVWFVIVCSIRLYRCVWVLENVIDIAARPARRTGT